MRTSEILMISGAIVPDRTAIQFDDDAISFMELQQRSNRLANAMADQGVGRGDRVAFMQVNCNQAIEVYFATAQLDAIYVPINFRAKTDELEKMLEIAQPNLLFIGERYLSLMNSGVNSGVNCSENAGDGANKGITTEQIIILDGDGSDGGQTYDGLLAGASDDDKIFPEAEDDDTTVIMFTAGTTGVPKGVMLTHDSFSSFLLSTVNPADPDIEESNLLTVPLYHIAGLQAALAAVYGGRTLIVMRQFEAGEWMGLVQEHRADRAMLVPTMLKQVMDNPRFHEFDLSSLDVITYGAAPMPVEVIRRAIQEFPGARFINAFGQTETASTITMLPPEDHVLEGTPEEIQIKLKRLSSIGKPLEDVEVQIVDADGTVVATGEVGEIVARGSRMMSGYWREDAATQAALRSGWIYTGDLGYQDEDRYIFLSGRAKDFIKRGGEMVSPEEVEQVLMSHPQVDDAAVIGIPDNEWGEEVRAVVVSRTGGVGGGIIGGLSGGLSEEELMQYCQDKLASFKRPRSVIFVDELPRNVMGKVLKRDLRDQHGS